MSTTRMIRHVDAPRATVYDALIDAGAVQTWMVPDGMTSQVHEFDAREGGVFRISLTYETSNAIGKTSAHTDTYHGRFVKLVPDTTVVQVMEFETEDPTMQGEMTVSYTLRDAHGGIDVAAVHDAVPRGVSPQHNETGWSMSLGKLAKLLESRS